LSKEAKLHKHTIFTSKTQSESLPDEAIKEHREKKNEGKNNIAGKTIRKYSKFNPVLQKSKLIVIQSRMGGRYTSLPVRCFLGNGMAIRHHIFSKCYNTDSKKSLRII
jgi:hypothetical protein